MSNQRIERYGMVPISVFEALADKKITTASVAVYAVIASYADRQGKAYPSQQCIADFLGMQRESVTRNVTRLIKSGLITVAGRKRGKRCHYILEKHPIK